MTTKQITRKIRDWSIIRDKAIYYRLGKRNDLDNYKKMSGYMGFVKDNLIEHCLTMIERYSNIEDYCDRKLLHYASELQIKLTK